MSLGMLMRAHLAWLVVGCCLCATGVIPVSSPALAQDEAAAVPASAEANPAGWNAGDPVDAIAYDDANDYTINTLIMFICAVLVIFMQAGFAMVEIGLNSAKNTVNILAKNVTDFCVVVILYLLI